jgi:carbon monoxide dehydrogenase subunit G
MAVVRSQTDVAVPPRLVWDYLTDWPRQSEWIPFTRVEGGEAARSVGGRFRAWTGIGPVGFWDLLTITGWEERADGTCRCEVLHTGNVVRGEAEFRVEPRDGGCTVVWSERIRVPGGPAGALAWRAAARPVHRVLDRALRRMASRAERLHVGG